jgi:phage I-like protein
MKRERRLSSLTALDLEAESLPTEFPIFFAGVNDSDKGAVLFDDIAAEAVMADYVKHGVDVHIDLEHLSLDPWLTNYNPDAMGWGKLELREGALWCVQIRWTPPGETRLRNKTQRYTSPAFYVDDVARVTKLINVALTALPATHNIPALVAASISRRSKTMTAETVKKLLDAIEAGDLEALKAMAKDLLAEAASGETLESADSDDATGEEALSGTADDPPPEEKKALSAAFAELRSLTGKSSVGELVAEVRRWHSEVAAAKERQEALDLSSRQELVSQLVKLGYETPATAWDGDAKLRKPAKRLLDEPLAELRSRVTKLSETPRPSGGHKPPAGKGPAELTPREQEYCKRHNMTAEQFAEHKKKIVVRR